MAKEYVVTFQDKDFHTLTNMLQLIVVGGMRFHAEGSAVPTVEQLNPIWKLLVKSAFAAHEAPPNIEKLNELEFLRYFFGAVYPCLGPADSEIVDSIKQQFKKTTGKELPAGYGEDE